MELNNTKSKFLSVIFALMPVLHQYLLTSSGSVTLALIVVSIAMFYAEIKFNRFVIRTDYLEKSYLALFISLLLFSLVPIFGTHILNFQGYLSRIINCFMFLYFLGTFRRYMDIDFAVNCLIVISVISSALCIIQLFINPDFGLYLPLRRIEADAYVSVGNKFFYRPNGLFGEPSHCAYYLTTTVLVYLFIEQKKSIAKTIAIIFIVCTCCIITSASAIYLLIGIALMYVILKKKNAKMLLKIFIALISLLLFIAIFGLGDFLSYGFERFDTSSSRLFNGFEFFAKYDWLQTLFGCGIGSYSMIRAGSTFLSGINRILVENGILGVLALLIFTINVTAKTKGTYRAFILFFLLLNLFESAFASIFLPFILAYIPVEKTESQTKAEGIKHYGNSSFIKR